MFDWLFASKKKKVKKAVGSDEYNCLTGTVYSIYMVGKYKTIQVDRWYDESNARLRLQELHNTMNSIGPIANGKFTVPGEVGDISVEVQAR